MGGTKMQINFIIILVVSIFIAIFAIQNGETVTIDLFFLRQEMSQALVILASVGLGALVTLVLSTFSKIKKAREIKGLNKRLRILEEHNEKVQLELNELTNENASLQQINIDIKGELTATEEQLRELKSQVKLVPAESPQQESQD